MDFFFQYRNPNFQSSSVVNDDRSNELVLGSNELVLDFFTRNPITNNKSTNSFHGKEGERKRNKRTNNNKMSTKVKLSTDPQSVAARERRHRISEKFKILRSLIPGGDTRNMDTVSMLEEAIQYVKHLKSQIWLHQTMISFENFDGYHDHDAGRNYNHLDQYPHQDFHPSGHFNDDYHHHEMLPQLGFEEGSSLKVEDEDYVVSLSHDHHHALYP